MPITKRSSTYGGRKRPSHRRAHRGGFGFNPIGGIIGGLTGLLGGRKRRTTHHRGRGLWDVIKKVGSVVKDNHLISTLAPTLLGPKYGPIAGGVAKSLGFGKRRHRTHRIRRGGRAITIV